MAHVVLNNGTVTGVFANPQSGISGSSDIPDNDPRIAAFLNPVDTAQQVALKQLQANDALMFRGLEVLIDALLAKGTLAAGDFSPAVRALYQARKALRVTAGVP